MATHLHKHTHTIPPLTKLTTMHSNLSTHASHQTKQVLTFERQVLKRRVKRDFIDLGQPPTVNGPGQGGRGAQTHQNQHSPSLSLHNGQQQRQPVQMNRPAARPSQFLRPPNQPPANQMGAFNYHQHQQTHGQTVGSNLQYSDNRRLGQSQLQPPNQRAHFFDQLEMNSSGPVPFFLHANFSNAQANGGAGSSNINKHRPPPPPIQMSATSGELQRNNQTFHYANETLRQAPFNDPSWPLMWYLVSIRLWRYSFTSKEL